MRTKFKVFLSVIITVLFTSCASTFYQVYQATPTEKIEIKENFLIYEDNNCRVFYNLWSEGGTIGFKFYNKTDKNIFLNLDRSFFILNDIAYDYYKNRVFIKSTSSDVTTSSSAKASKAVTGYNYLDFLQTNKIQGSNSVGLTTSSGYSTSFNEEKVICIPSNTSKIITEYNINKTLYRDCDLFKYPKRKQIETKSFSKTESPIVFSNRISYRVDDSDEIIKFENEFYVSKITNYPENELLESKYKEFCGQKSTSKTNFFKDVSPNKFYIKYSKEQDTWKH